MKTRAAIPTPPRPLAPLLALALALALPATLARPHCQIPCGIYDDAMRFDMIEEHITTIEKAMNEITRLSKTTDPNYNQIVRWVANKDDHASQLTEIVTHYFMAQRVKPAAADDAEYVKKIILLHSMMVEAMKCKQTTDLEYVKALRDLAARFHHAYLSEADKQHMKDHHNMKNPQGATQPGATERDAAERGGSAEQAARTQ